MADSWGKSDIICSTYPKTAGDLSRRYKERAKAAEMLCQKGHLSPVRMLRDNEGPVAPAEDKCLTDTEMPGRARHDVRLVDEYQDTNHLDESQENAPVTQYSPGITVPAPSVPGAMVLRTSSFCWSMVLFFSLMETMSSTM